MSFCTKIGHRYELDAVVGRRWHEFAVVYMQEKLPPSVFSSLLQGHWKISSELQTYTTFELRPLQHWTAAMQGAACRRLAWPYAAVAPLLPLEIRRPWTRLHSLSTRPVTNLPQTALCQRRRRRWLSKFSACSFYILWSGHTDGGVRWV